MRIIIFVIVGFIVVAMWRGARDTEEIASQTETPEVLSRTEADPAQAPWVAHDFTIVEDDDISTLRRIRRSVSIVAPTAMSSEDRIADAYGCGNTGLE